MRNYLVTAEDYIPPSMLECSNRAGASYGMLARVPTPTKLTFSHGEKFIRRTIVFTRGSSQKINLPLWAKVIAVTCNWRYVTNAQGLNQHRYSFSTLTRSQSNARYEEPYFYQHMQAGSYNEVLSHKATRGSFKHCTSDYSSRLGCIVGKRSIYSQIETITIGNVCISHPMHLFYRGSIVKLSNQPRIASPSLIKDLQDVSSRS